MLGLEKALKTIAEQARGVPTTTRMLVGALMVILVLCLVLVGTYTGRAEMMPLGLAGPAKVEARARAVSYLQARGVAFEEDGSDILVPQERKHAILADLTESDLITADQIDFESVLAQDSPFTDRQTRRSRLLVAKMNEVARMISELSGIDRATVVIDQPERTGGLGATHIPPTAAVTVHAREPLTASRADSIARIVAGSHASLKLSGVTVVDARTGRSIVGRDDDDLGQSEYLEMQREAERHAQRKIVGALGPVIPGVVVAVNAQVDNRSAVEDSTSFDAPKSGVVEELTSDQSATQQTTSRQPGVRINTGDNLAGGGGRTSNTTATKSATKQANAFPNSETHTIDPRGYPLKINASILVPRSHYERVYWEKQGAPTGPDENAEIDVTTFEALVEVESERIRGLVDPLVDTVALQGAVKGTVVVSMFTDVTLAGVGVLGSEGGVLVGGSGLLSGGVVKSVVLGGLALVSLFLMFMMVRRATREEELPTAEELLGVPPALAEAEAEIVGEAEESPAAMEGLELDESDVRRQQMLEQINALAKESAGDTATLLRRWVKEG